MSKVCFIDLFSGIGAFPLGAYQAGFRCDQHYFSEIDKYASAIYNKRFPDAEALGDITKVDGELLIRPGTTYVIAGGFPCQNISEAGKRDGLEGSQSSLWYEYLRLIKQIKPNVVLIENVDDLSIRGLDKVIANLYSAGYDSCWRIISAADMGAPHLRKRLFIIAYPSGIGDPALMSFRLKRRRAVSGHTVTGIEFVSYFDKYFVGRVIGNEGVYDEYGYTSIGRDMPKGGFCLGGLVYAVPAWEKGLDVYEVMENTDDSIRGRDEQGVSGEVSDSAGVEGVRSRSTDEFIRAGVGYETLVNTDSSRCSRHIYDEEKKPRGSGLGCEQYIELEGFWDTEPTLQRVVDGIPWYVGVDGKSVPFPVAFERGVHDRKQLNCLGNAMLPQIAWLLFRMCKPLLPKDCYLG